MGVDTWYAYGIHVDEATLVRLTDATAKYLRPFGYRYGWLDAGWWTGSRASDGTIAVDRAQWPHGMAWIASYIHRHGLLAGIYTDVGVSGCPPAGGSHGHIQQDVDTFARWGFDALKLDFCGWISTRLTRNRRSTEGGTTRTTSCPTTG
jgi:alpha-galactosidase